VAQVHFFTAFCLFTGRITKKLWVDFHEIWRTGKLWTIKEMATLSDPEEHTVDIVDRLKVY